MSAKYVSPGEEMTPFGRPVAPVQVDLETDLAIRQLRFRLADALCHADADAYAATFTPDGVWALRGRRLEGRNAIRELLAQRLGNHAWQMQNYMDSTILSVSETEIRARAYFIEHGEESGLIKYVLGFYDELCVKQPAGWYYAERVANIIYLGSPDLTTRPMRPNPTS